MPESNGSPREVLLAVYGRTFGVAESDLGRFTVEAKGEEIWATTAPAPARVHTRRPAGLRAIRLMPDGPKPTSAFLAALGDRVHASRVDLDFDTLRSLLLGRRVATDHPNAYVALVYEGLVLGCGRVRHSELQALIPTGRRRELLEVLSKREPSPDSKL